MLDLGETGLGRAERLGTQLCLYQGDAVAVRFKVDDRPAERTRTASVRRDAGRSPIYSSRRARLQSANTLAVHRCRSDRPAGQGSRLGRSIRS
jgi:hypothetical protein